MAHSRLGVEIWLVAEVVPKGLEPATQRQTPEPEYDSAVSLQPRQVGRREGDNQIGCVRSG